MSDARPPATTAGKPLKRTVTLAAAVALLVGLPVAVGPITRIVAAHSVVRPLPFDAEAWRRGEPIEGYRTVRSQMVDDLISSRRLAGLTRAEVEQLLGPPLHDVASAGVDSRRWHMAYRLGLERHGYFSLDDEFLAIRLDETEKVVEYSTVVN